MLCSSLDELDDYVLALQPPVMELQNELLDIIDACGRNESKYAPRVHKLYTLLGFLFRKYHNLRYEKLLRNPTEEEIQQEDLWVCLTEEDLKQLNKEVKIIFDKMRKCHHKTLQLLYEEESFSIHRRLRRWFHHFEIFKRNFHLGGWFKTKQWETVTNFMPYL